MVEIETKKGGSIRDSFIISADEEYQGRPRETRLSGSDFALLIFTKNVDEVKITCDGYVEANFNPGAISFIYTRQGKAYSKGMIYGKHQNKWPVKAWLAAKILGGQVYII